MRQIARYARKRDGSFATPSPMREGSGDKFGGFGGFLRASAPASVLESGDI